MRTSGCSFLLTLAALSCAGCSTTLSTLQTAEPIRPRHVHATGTFDVNVPVTRIVDTVDVTQDLTRKFAADTSYRPTAEDQRRLLGAAVGLGMSSPGVNPDVMVRTGVVKDVDVGVRWSGLAAHVDAKYRFLRTAAPAEEAPEEAPESSSSSSFLSKLGDAPENPGFQGAISVGVSKALYSGLVFDALEYLHIDDYSRWNVEVPVIFGSRLGNFGHLWFGPKYVYSHYSLDASLQNFGVVPHTSGSIHHLGGFFGAAFGYKVAFLVTELTVMKMWAEPEIFGQRTDLGGIVVVPSVGFMLRL